MVQASKLDQLQQAWKDKGSPPCDHPTLDKEYALGGGSDDWGCLTCGERFTRAELRALGRQP